MKCSRMRKSEPRDRKKCEVNSEPRSEETWSGMPCLAKTWDTKASAMSMAVALSVVGMNMLSFDKRSIITSIAVKPSDDGSCSMKSMEIECQGRSGIGSGCSRPYGQWREGLFRAQSTHCDTKDLQSRRRLGHE